MEFIVQFLVPFFGLLTAGLFLTAIWQMKTSQKQEKSATDRHIEISKGHSNIYKEVQKVTHKLDNEVLPNLTAAFEKRSPNLFELSTEGLSEALDKIGYPNPFVSDDSDFFLVGLEDDEEKDEDIFKAYYFIRINTEAKDLIIESHGYEFDSFNEQTAQIILSLNDKFKISGFSVESFDGRYVLKSQYLIDAPEKLFSSKTLNFAIDCLFEAQKELTQLLSDNGSTLKFIDPNDLIQLQYEATIPNKSLKQDK